MDHLRTLLSARPARGLSLLEAIIAAGIMSLAAITILAFLAQQGTVQSIEMRETLGQSVIRRGINLAVFQLEECRPIGITADGRTFEFVLPLRDSVTRQVRCNASTDKPMYGIREDGGKEYDRTDSVKKYNFYVLTARVRTTLENGVRMRPNPSDANEQLSEAVVGVDLNGDGDVADVVEGVSEAVVKDDLNDDNDKLDYYIYFDLELGRADNSALTQLIGGPYAVLKDNTGKDGKVFSLECEPITPPTYTAVDLYDSKSKTFLSIYDNTSNILTDLNLNSKWDASIIILMMYVDLGSPANQLKVARTKVYLRNTD